MYEVITEYMYEVITEYMYEDVSPSTCTACRYTPLAEHTRINRLKRRTRCCCTACMAVGAIQAWSMINRYIPVIDLNMTHYALNV